MPRGELKVTSMADMPPVRRACGTCGRLGHLATTCTAPARAHVKLGIEVEGYWRQVATPEAPETWQTAQVAAESWHMGGDSDGSLSHFEGYRSWEFKTRPGSLGEAISQLKAVYPHATADCAGMHVHVSFKHLTDISALSTPAFFAFFEARWEAWGARMEIHRDSNFWSRLRGQNQYCRRNVSYQVCSDITDHDRYRALNFSSWRRHKTVECRMLPMFRDARLGVLAVEELIAIFEDYLASLSATLSHDVTVPADAMPPVVSGVLTESHEVAISLPDVYAADVSVAEIEAPTYAPTEPGFVRIPYATYEEYITRTATRADVQLRTAMQGVV